MTKQEFYEWKANPHTKAVFDVVKGHIDQLEYNLAREAGLDSGSDRYKAGILRGMELILEIDWEDPEDAQ